MNDNLKKIDYLPTVDEFEAILLDAHDMGNTSVLKEVIISINVNLPIEVTCAKTSSLPAFTPSGLGVILGRYNEFRLLLLKLMRTDNTLVSFNLVTSSTEALSALIYTNEQGSLRFLNYHRTDSGDWFNEDLLADLKRLTKNVPDLTDEEKDQTLKDALHGDIVNSGYAGRGQTSSLIHYDDFSYTDTKTSTTDATNVTEESKSLFSNFKIGDHFKFSGMDMVNRVTDIGTRTLIYIHLDQEDPRNYNGPPYSVVERVLDKDELVVIQKVENND